MPHEPKLTVYKIYLSPANANVVNTCRNLFRNIIGQANQEQLEDSFIITEVFKKFIEALDTPKMFSDPVSKKCMTANQANIADDNVDTNISFNPSKYTIEGKIEGGSYGRKRNKTSTEDKANKTGVSEKDAITDDFYFLLYLPVQSNKITLLLQSYSDDTIDSVMKRFCESFFSFKNEFNKAKVQRFVPKAIIDDFKKTSTVSSLTFTTEIPGESLMEHTETKTDRSYRVVVQVIPTDSDFTIEEFEESISPIEQAYFTRLFTLGQFAKKKGTLKDSSTEKTTPFELGSDFEIQPTILLSKYIEIKNDESDFVRIKEYCLKLLEVIKPEIYIQNAVQER